jgi:hypothetical protein
MQFQLLRRQEDCLSSQPEQHSLSSTVSPTTISKAQVKTSSNKGNQTYQWDGLSKTAQQVRDKVGLKCLIPTL